MALNATRPATPAAVAQEGTTNTPAELAVAPTVPPPAPDAEEAEPRIAPGTMVSERYRIARVLGEGGMGVVYAAEHVLMRKEVAVKVLHAEMCSMPEVVARFEREAIAAAHIDHPNVAGATDFGRLDDGSCFLVLELLKGSSLRDEIKKGPIPTGRALRILRGIASGVAAAHAKGVIHRDLKPENVMLVDRDGDVDFVKVLDFGIAKVDANIASAGQSVGKVLTRVGTVFGTPEYMAPEQAVGDTVDARADLYALGVIFLEMLTGKCPFSGNALSILRERILSVGPPDMSEVADADARALIARLLARQPEDRVQTAMDLVAAVDTIAENRLSALPAATAQGLALASQKDMSAPAIATDSGDRATALDVLRRRRSLVLPIGVALALLVTLTTFGIVKAFSSSDDPTKTAARAHTESAASAIVVPAPHSPPSAAIEPPPTPDSPSELEGRRAPSSDLDDAPPKPMPSASAASARAAPRGKPPRRPQRRGSGGGVLQPFKDLIK